MSCEMREESLLLYALGILESAELDDLRTHLESGCPQCEGRLAEARAILEILPFSLMPVVPPVGAREQLLARVSEQRQPDIATLGSMKIASDEPVDQPIRPDRWLSPALIGAGIAAGVTALALSTILSSQRKSIDGLRSQLSRKDDELVQMRSAEQAAKDINRLVESPAVQIVSLQGTDAQPSAKGRLLWDPASKSFQFYAVDLKNLAAGRAYELWIINSDKQKIRAGMFSVDAHGVGSVASTLSVPAGTMVASAVTDEPLAGVPQPTGSIQLLGKVQ